MKKLILILLFYNAYIKMLKPILLPYSIISNIIELSNKSFRQSDQFHIYLDPNTGKFVIKLNHKTKFIEKITSLILLLIECQKLDSIYEYVDKVKYYEIYSETELYKLNDIFISSHISKKYSLKLFLSEYRNILQAEFHLYLEELKSKLSFLSEKNRKNIITYCVNKIIKKSKYDNPYLDFICNKYIYFKLNKKFIDNKLNNKIFSIINKNCIKKIK